MRTSNTVTLHTVHRTLTLTRTTPSFSPLSLLECSPSPSSSQWASSDLGVSWVQVTAAAPWQVRDHGVLLATPQGVLISTAGGFGEYQTNGQSTHETETE